MASGSYYPRNLRWVNSLIKGAKGERQTRAEARTGDPERMVGGPCAVHGAWVVQKAPGMTGRRGGREDAP